MRGGWLRVSADTNLLWPDSCHRSPIAKQICNWIPCNELHGNNGGRAGTVKAVVFAEIGEYRK